MEETTLNKENLDMARKLTVEAKIRKAKYDAQYDAEHTTQVKLKLNNKLDADILSWLSTLPNKQGVIKLLIRQQMEREGFTEWFEKEKKDKPEDWRPWEIPNTQSTSELD